MKHFRLLAVVSAKGSPGCTFVAAGLAGRLAERGLATLLADADAEEPGIASLLDLPAPAARAGHLGRLAPLETAQLTGWALPVAPNLHWLQLSGSGVEGGDLVAAAGAYAAVVVDLGHRREDLQTAVLSAADWALWVVTPDRVGVERADRALGAADLQSGSTGLVLNRCGRSTLKDAGSVLAERHRLPVLARMPESGSAASRLLRLALPANRAREFRPMFDELARTLHPDLQRPDAGRGGGAWSR